MMYHFTCTQCDLEFGVELPVDAPKEAACPHCHSKDNVKRVWSRGIDFSRGGSGFHVNDYKKGG